MGQVSHSKREVKLSTYREIIERFLPYVLIKCAKYTNSKRLAEIIAIYTFTGVYRLAEQLDGSNKMPVVSAAADKIDSMLAIVGPDFADKPGNPVGDKLFEEGTLRAAKTLSELDIEECISRMDCVADSFDRGQFDRITAAVMDYLAGQNRPLKRINREDYENLY